MILAQIIIGLVMIYCLYEWHHLSQNNILRDEHQYLVIALILACLLAYTFFINEPIPETNL